MIYPPYKRMIQKWNISLKNNDMEWYIPPTKNEIALAKNDIHIIIFLGKVQIAVQAVAWLLW